MCSLNHTLVGEIREYSVSESLWFWMFSATPTNNNMTTEIRSLSSDQLKELEVLVERWAGERNILSQGETIEMSLRVIGRPVVTIDVNQPNEWDYKKLKDSSGSTYKDSIHILHAAGVVNSAEDFDSLTYKELAQVTREQMMVSRNLRSKSRVRDLQNHMNYLGYKIDWLPPKKNSREGGRVAKKV